MKTVDEYKANIQAYLIGKPDDWPKGITTTLRRIAMEHGRAAANRVIQDMGLEAQGWAMFRIGKPKPGRKVFVLVATSEECNIGTPATVLKRFPDGRVRVRDEAGATAIFPGSAVFPTQEAAEAAIKQLRISVSERRAIKTDVSPTAAERLTSAEIETAVNGAAARAERGTDWRPGKGFRIEFTKGGKWYAVAISYVRAGEVRAIVGLRQEVTGQHRSAPGRHA